MAILDHLNHVCHGACRCRLTSIFYAIPQCSNSFMWLVFISIAGKNVVGNLTNPTILSRTKTQTVTKKHRNNRTKYWIRPSILSIMWKVANTIWTSSDRWPIRMPADTCLHMTCSKRHPYRWAASTKCFVHSGWVIDKLCSAQNAIRLVKMSSWVIHILD